MVGFLFGSTKKKKLNFFFIRAHARSGTNWLENILNLHPEIDCKGEYDFNYLGDHLRILLNQKPGELSEKGNLKEVAKEKFGELVRECMVENISKLKKHQVRWVGDRTPGNIKPILVEDSSYIWILRDGRDVLVSLTYHFLNLDRDGLRDNMLNKVPSMNKKREIFRKNPDYFKSHPKELLDDENWVRYFAKYWKEYIEENLHTLEEIKRGLINVRCHVLKYEDLHKDIELEKEKLYKFLKLNPQKAKKIEKLSMPGFDVERPTSHYRKGIVGDWKNYFTENTIKWFNEEAKDILIRLGYEKN